MPQPLNSNVIIVNGNNPSFNLQIVFPSFRPINLYEIEDSFDDLCQEIESHVSDEKKIEEILLFVGAFKEAIDEGNVVPIAEYFMKHHFGRVDIDQLKTIFDAVNGFISLANDENRLMN